MEGHYSQDDALLTATNDSGSINAADTVASEWRFCVSCGTKTYGLSACSNCSAHEGVGRSNTAGAGEGADAKRLQGAFQLLMIILLVAILVALGYIGVQLKALADVVRVVDDDVKLTGAVTSVLSAIVTSFATTLQAQIANVPSLAEDLMQYDYAPQAKSFQDTLTSLRDDYSQVHADFCGKHTHHNRSDPYWDDDADDTTGDRLGTCRLQPIDRANFFIGIMDTVKASHS